VTENSFVSPSHSPPTLSLGIVIERREIDNPWQDYTFRPAGVIPHAPELGKWQVLREGDGWAHFHAGTLPLELFKGETEGYRFNLSQSPPSVFIILRQGETDEENEVEPFLLTVCPYEASCYIESGDEIVEGVQMPPEIITWVQDFVTEHHVDVPFTKRKNKRHKDQEKNRGRRSVQETTNE